MHRTGIEDYYIIKDQKKLHFGYTTGTCAAAAAQAAVRMLLEGGIVSEVKIDTPKGITLNLEIVDIERKGGGISCGVVKYGGDDPDATNGLTICALAEKTAQGLIIDGGEGVGRVTKSGLKQAVGEAAINPVPMQMIRENALAVCRQLGYEQGLKITIFVPGGEEAARKTFNPRLGILGGISILGTKGIVEPMSESALIASIQLEMEMQRRRGAEYLLVTPGSYGETFARDTLELDTARSVQCSNYVGEMLDCAVNLEYKGILLISHIGKFIKVAGGIMNTHSRDADCRAELMAAFGLRAGADREQAVRLLESNTTDEALDMLNEMHLREAASAMIMERAQAYMQHRTGGAILTEAVMYGTACGMLGMTGGAGTLLKQFSKQE